jgi:phosphoesterase RecJ-like protein
MIDQTKVDEIKNLIDSSSKIVIIQAGNPDGDSLGSSLALEQILSDLKKDVVMYCGVGMPTYLRYLPGWDRVEDELPKDFDLSIIVDCSSISLLDTLTKSNEISRMKNKPCIILDHHQGEGTIDFASISLVTQAVATGELIYDLAKQLGWTISLEAMNMLSIAIMSDSLGLTTEATTAHSIHTIAELVEGGVNLAEIDSSRRELMRKSPDLVRYKGELLQRVEYYDDDRIAIVSIPWVEIEKYSPHYNC